MFDIMGSPMLPPQVPPELINGGTWLGLAGFGPGVLGLRDFRVMISVLMLYRICQKRSRV